MEEIKLILEEVDTPKKYKRYTFNIQALSTDDLDVDSISMDDVPENVREGLAKEIVKYPRNQIIVWDNEYDDRISDDINDDKSEENVDV